VHNNPSYQLLELVNKYMMVGAFNLIRQRQRILNCNISRRSFCHREIQRHSSYMKGKVKHPRSIPFLATSRFFSLGKKTIFAARNDEVSWEVGAWVGLFGTIGFTMGYLSPDRTATENRPSELMTRFNESIEKTSVKNDNSLNTQPAVLATSSLIGEARPSIFLDNEPEISDQVDFIIIGYGNAGQEAVKALQEKCPNASFMIIDPNLMNVPSERDAKRMKIKKVQHLVGSAVGLDHDKKTVLVFASNVEDKSGTDHKVIPRPGMKRIRFNQSILIATGSRGAPPPQSLVDEKAMDRVLELRSTSLLSLHQYYLYVKLLLRQKKIEEVANNMTEQSITQEDMDGSYPRYPILPPRGVREIALMAASQGARICILGSGLDALDLAATCVLAKKDDSSVSLVFGSPSPLSTVLPRYLCTAVSKRLKTIGVQIEDRSLIRYVSFKDADNANASENGSSENAVEVHIENSSDGMDTHRRTADLLVVAPSRVGLRGSAVIPTLSTLNQTSFPQLEFQPWSKLTPINQPVVSCFEDDGRIVVNSELCAASGVYAAGSVAKYPNPITGHAEVAGEGTVSGPLAGQIAANNMAKDYHRDCTRGKHSEDISSRCLSQEESLAVWRTDECVRGIGHASSNGSEKSALSRVGINALCVGQCDSEIYGTHGFWWTNQSYQKRLTRRRGLNTVDESDSAKVRKRAVYGSGIVFYLDRAGAIRGIMVWGLPFTNINGKDNSLNEKLIQRMKTVILTNGEIMVKEHTSVIMDKQLDPEKLQVAHLSEESRVLASIAVSSTNDTSQLSNTLLHKDFSPRPLYRFINPKPVSYTSLGRLKRNEEIGYGSTGEDIFARRDNVFEKTAHYSRHPSLVYYCSWESSDPFNQFENAKNDEDQEYGARPPKEEPLWKRQSETNKSLSVSDVLSEMFMANILKGQFSDGSDAVKQAPVPAIYKDAKEAFNDWTSTNDSEDGESNSDD